LINTGVRGTWLKFAFVAFLGVAGLTGAALAQDPDGSRSTGTDPTTEPKPKPKFVKLPEPHQTVGARVELFHLPTFNAAGSIESGAQLIGLGGVVITSVDAQCGSSRDAWPCGRMARAALQPDL
jgi:hypothetical protein